METISLFFDRYELLRLRRALAEQRVLSNTPEWRVVQSLNWKLYSAQLTLGYPRPEEETEV